VVTDDEVRPRTGHVPRRERAAVVGVDCLRGLRFASRVIQYFDDRTDMQTANRHLMWYGMFLFLLGLVTGLVEQRFTNVRMGLAAHLEGVMNGTFLVALGAIWTAVRLPPAAEATAYWSAVYGTYANWLVTTLAAVFGTAAFSPISATGLSAQPGQESLVATGFLSVSVAIILSTVLVFWGLRTGASQSTRD